MGCALLGGHLDLVARLRRRNRGGRQRDVLLADADLFLHRRELVGLILVLLFELLKQRQCDGELVAGEGFVGAEFERLRIAGGLCGLGHANRRQ